MSRDVYNQICRDVVEWMGKNPSAYPEVLARVEEQGEGKPLRLLIDDVNVSPWITVDPEWSPTGVWTSRKTGRLRVCVGDYGDRVSFPPRKDGTYNIPKIAGKLVGIVYGKRRQAAAQATRDRNSQLARDLAAEYGTESYTLPFRVTDMDKSPFRLEASYVYCNVEQARKILDLLIELGLVTGLKRSES